LKSLADPQYIYGSVTHLFGEISASASGDTHYSGGDAHSHTSTINTTGLSLHQPIAARETASEPQVQQKMKNNTGIAA
jgi:hypothetical protein